MKEPIPGHPRRPAQSWPCHLLTCCVSLGNLLPVSELVLRFLLPGPGAGLVPPGSVQSPGQTEERKWVSQGSSHPRALAWPPRLLHKACEDPWVAPHPAQTGKPQSFENRRGRCRVRGEPWGEGVRGAGMAGWGGLDRCWVETRHRGREAAGRGEPRGGGGGRFMEEKKE